MRKIMAFVGEKQVGFVGGYSVESNSVTITYDIERAMEFESDEECIGAIEECLMAVKRPKDNVVWGFVMGEEA